MSDGRPADLAAPRAAPLTVMPIGAVTACAAFVLIGALQALYGPAISAFRADYGVSLPVAGLALGTQFLGGIGGVIWYARNSPTLSTPAKLAISLVLMAIGSAAFALAPNWPLALTGAFVAGLGFGGIDYGFNDLFARAFERRRTAMLNVLNAHFGLGAILGPFLIAAFGPGQYPAIFLGLAMASVLLLVGVRGIHPEHGARSPGQATDGDPAAPFRRSALLLAFVVFYLLNVGVEAGVGGWEPTHLQSLGHSATAAASATSVFWLMLTVGRFLVVPLTVHWSDRAIVTGSCVGMAICLALANVHGLAAVAYAGVGLFIAPVFPTGLPWLHRIVPGAQRAGAYVFAASMIGGVAFPPLLGVGIAQVGAGSIPVLLFALNALCLLMIWSIVRAERRQHVGP